MTRMNCKTTVPGSELKLFNMEEMELILIEALNNAFIHGNKGEKDKPIYSSREFSDGLAKFVIKDSGADSF